MTDSSENVVDLPLEETLPTYTPQTKVPEIVPRNRKEKRFQQRQEKKMYGKKQKLLDARKKRFIRHSSVHSTIVTTTEDLKD